MPVIKSAKKRVKVAQKAHERNQDRRTSLKTAIKKVLTALEQNDVEYARTLLKQAESKLARAKNKGVVHANTAARKIGRLAKKVSTAARS